MAKLQFSPPITDVKEMTRNGKLNWEKSALKSYAKASSVRFKPNRMDTTFEPDFIMPNFDIYGRDIVNKPGVYPYGSATGTTPVTSTSLKAGTYKRAKIKGKDVTKRKQNKLWGRYIPAVASNTTTYPMVLVNLFDETTVTKGEFYNDSGVLTINEATYYSAPVPASQGDVFTISRESAVTTVYLRIHAFNADGTWLAMLGKSAETTSTSVTSSACPANTAYIVVCGAHRNGAIDPHTMVVKGSTAHLYIPYGSWKFVKDTVANTFGYYNEETGEYVAAQGATGTVIQPVTYVHSDSDGYANTEADHSNSNKWVVDIKFPTSSSRALIGYSTDTGAYFGSDASDRYELGGGIFIEPPPSATERHIVTFDRTAFDVTTSTTKLTVEGKTISRVRSGSGQVSPFKTIVPGYPGNGNDIYRLTGYFNDTLIRDYIPVRVGTSVELLDLVNWQFAALHGALTAGVDIPYTELCSDILETNAGDALYGQYGKNKFDKDTTSYHMYYTPQGVWQRASSVSSSDFIEVKPNTTYVLSGESFSSSLSKRINLLDANKNWISQPVANVNYPLTVTTTANTKYIRFSFGETDSGIDTNIQFEIGSTPTPHEPYHFGLHPSGKQKLFMGEQGVITFDGSSDENWAYDATYGRFSITVSDAKVGTTRTIQAYAPGWNCLWNREPIENVQNGDFYVGTTNILFHSGETSVADWKAKIQAKPITLFYQRSTDTSFIPPTIREIDTFLPSANSFIDPQKPSNNVECDWKFKVFTGADSEDWQMNDYQGAISFYTTISDMIETAADTPSSNFLCTALDYNSSVWVGNKVGFAVYTLKRLFFRPAGIETLADFKAWLAEKQPIFWYPLATPEVTTVTIPELTQPLGTVTILNEFEDSTKGAVDFYGVNVQIDTPVPKPDEPFPLLSNAGEVSYGQWGKNLFDKTAVTTGKYLDSTGALVTNSKWNVSDYMPVEGGETYYQRLRTTGQAPRTGWYTANKTFISASAQVAGGTQTAPSNAAYCRMSIWEDELDIAMFTHGADAPTEYEPYHFGWHGDGQQTAKMESLNLFNTDQAVHNGMTYTVTKNGDTYTAVAGASTVSSSRAMVALPKAFFKPNTTYAVLIDGATPNNIVVGKASVTSSTGYEYYGTITGKQGTVRITDISDSQVYVSFYIYFGAKPQGTTYNFRVMVKEGTAIPTAYSPYATPQTRTTSEILPSATSKMNMQGGPDNKDCDWVFKALDGTETGWGLASNGTVAYLPITDGMTGDPTTFRVSIPCSHFVGTDALNADMPNYSIKLSVSSAEPNISKVWIKFDGNVIDLTAFKALLAEVKPIVAYPRATSVKSTVTTTPFTVPDKTEYVASSDSESGVCDVAITCLSKSM